MGYGLLVRDDKRYQVTHPPVHTYARERMAPADDVFGRLAAYYDALARQERERGPEGYVVLDGKRAPLLAPSALLSLTHAEQPLAHTM